MQSLEIVLIFYCLQLKKHYFFHFLGNSYNMDTVAKEETELSAKRIAGRKQSLKSRAIIDYLRV